MDRGGVGRGRARLLLASSSIAALLIGGSAPAAYAACGVFSFNGVSNSGVSNSGAITCIDIENSTISGNVSNVGPGGVITANGAAAPSKTGITINNSTVTGTVSNSGTINANASGILIWNNATVSGGVANSGTISAAATTTAQGIHVFDVSLFAGGVANTGTISVAAGGYDGIAVGVFGAVSTLIGDISNGGTISAPDVGIHVDSVANFTGNITNSGNLSASHTGIWIHGNISTFTGNISNSGTISATSFTGIHVEDVTSFAGSISNSGTISAPSSTGILVDKIANFAGGISNSGSITAGGAGIVVSKIAVFGGSSASGGISNNGAITAGSVGIVASEIHTFAGGITNSGTIFAGGAGIVVSKIAVFGGSSAAGGISNSGAITAGSVGIVASEIRTFAGGITNSGTIFAGGAGILVSKIAVFGGSSAGGAISNNGTIFSTNTGILVSNVTSFLGGITNSGLIAGFNSTGIFVGLRGSSSTVFAHLSTFSGGISNSGSVGGDFAGIAVAAVGGFSGTPAFLHLSAFSGGITNSGTIAGGFAGIALAAIGGYFGTPAVLRLSTFSGGISNSGTIAAGFAGILVGASANSGLHISTFDSGISNSGLIEAGIVGILVSADSSSLLHISNFSGGITNSGTILAGEAGIVVGGSPGSNSVRISTFSGNISNSGTIVAFSGTGILIGSGVTFAAGSSIVNTGTISGGGGTAIDVTAATSTVTIDINGGLISGAIDLSANADQLNISGGIIAGNIVGQGTDTVTFMLGAGTFTYGSAFGFTGIDQVNVNSGTVILDGANQATSVAVNGGTLEIGDAANPGALLEVTTLTVNNGGILAGNGTIDFPLTTVTIAAGGTLAPGTPGSLGTLTIDGALTFDANSYYAINIVPGAGNNSKTAVTGGVAGLNGNGTVVVTPQLGHYDTTYQILTTPSPAQLSGKFAGLTVNGDFSGAIALDYATDPGDVDLDVNGSSLLATPPGANVNQRNVVGGINSGIMNWPVNTPLPQQFQNLGGLPNALLLNALTQLDGEVATGAQTSAFQLMNAFLNLLLDPTSLGGSGGGGPLGFTPEQASLPPDVALAYASILKAPPPASFNQRWTSWGAAYGGSSTTDGDAVIGSNTITASDYGFAGGMEYHFSSNTVAGFGLAGGGTNWGLAQGLGTGRSDAFQAGLYAKRYFGSAYVAGAVAFTNNWFTTKRTALGDQFTASFDGQSYAARFEGGYRYGLTEPTPGAVLGVTPYAALQTQWFHTPAYSETDLSGGGFGLTYNAMNANDTRSELGVRFDDLTQFHGMPLILRGRLAWAHDWVSNPSLAAAFQALPGSSFVVYGAAPPTNSALTTVGAELRMTPDWSLLAKFDGQFAPGSQTYAGSGTLRYQW